VSGIFRPETMYRAGWLALLSAGLIGLVLAWFAGPLVLVFGGIGALGGYFYTNGKKPYKYLGVGPFCVFVLMGPLMVLPSYFIQAGHLSLSPLLGSLGIACLVAAIMHANDIRDIAHDRAAGILTLAMLLGRRRAAWLFTGLTVGAFCLLGLGVAGGLVPWPCLVAACVLLPVLGGTLRRIQVPGYDFVDLEGWTGKFHFQFGLLLLAGLAASRLAA
jgi:1,4-dihydroxy-2-naphthoate octaprenyltransferase